MRVLLLGGAAIIAVAAATVPLPWSVTDPSQLRPVTDGVTIALAAEVQRRADDRGVSGEYLAVQHRGRATTLQLLAAAALPQPRIERRGPPVTGSSVHPLVAATMSGLGIVPRHADATDIPVTVHVSGGVDSSALGAALYAFDVGTRLDVARGRRIVGVGRMVNGGHLVCSGAVAESIVAAAAERVDVVVVPTDCAEDATAAIPHDAQLEVIDANVLVGATDALLAQ